jgi:hypothetical protein
MEPARLVILEIRRIHTTPREDETEPAMPHVIAPRGLRVLGALCIVGFAVAGPVVVAHPGIDQRLGSRLMAATVISTVIWLLWNLALEPRIVLGGGIVAVHYPYFRRDIPAGQVTDVQVKEGDLVILTADGGKAKPPTLRASVVGALSGNGGARSARGQILDYVHQVRENGNRSKPRRVMIIVKLQLWVLIIPLTVLFTEAFLTTR